MQEYENERIGGERKEENGIAGFIHLIGAFCTILGLAEMIRLVVSYWRTYGLVANFPLEIIIYSIGITWTFATFIKFVDPADRILRALRINA